MSEYEHHSYDVVVIGAGGAGLRAAIAAHDAGARTAVICKSLLGKAHTVMAEGGIAAAMGNAYPDDNWQVHFRDTMRGGKLLNHWRMAELHAKEAPERVWELEQWGALFDRTPDGLISQRDFGGHRYARLAHVGDRTGLEMIRTLQQRTVQPRHRRVHGVHGHQPAQGWRTASRGRSPTGGSPGGFVVFDAPAVVLATGGIGKSWKVTSNSWEYTGDGHALALRAGATLVNMEFVQFHPTGMVWPPSVRGLLVTESVRGDGGVLRNSDGERFMYNYIPEFFKAETSDTEEEADRWYTDKVNNRRPAELLPRDEVARAINNEIKEGRGSPHGGVYPRHRQPPQPRVHQEAAAVDVPPVHGAGRGGHHQGGHGDRADLPLRDGRGRGRPRHRGFHGRPVCTRPARSPAGCTGPTGSAATRSSDLLVFGRRAGDLRRRVRRRPGRRPTEGGRGRRRRRRGRGARPLRHRGRREPVLDPPGPAGRHAGPGRHHPHRVGDARRPSTRSTTCEPRPPT